eukprot:gene6482-6709_t
MAAAVQHKKASREAVLWLLPPVDQDGVKGYSWQALLLFTTNNNFTDSRLRDNLLDPTNWQQPGQQQLDLSLLDQDLHLSSQHGQQLMSSSGSNKGVVAVPPVTLDQGPLGTGKSNMLCECMGLTLVKLRQQRDACLLKKLEDALTNNTDI